MWSRFGHHTYLSIIPLCNIGFSYLFAVATPQGRGASLAAAPTAPAHIKQEAPSGLTLRTSVHLAILLRLGLLSVRHLSPLGLRRPFFVASFPYPISDRYREPYGYNLFPLLEDFNFNPDVSSNHLPDTIFNTATSPRFPELVPFCFPGGVAVDHTESNTPSLPFPLDLQAFDSINNDLAAADVDGAAQALQFNTASDHTIEEEDSPSTPTTGSPPKTKNPLFTCPQCDKAYQKQHELK